MAGQIGEISSISKDNGKFGFITIIDPPDAGATEMFVMPAACRAFGGEIPPVGTMVKYTVVTDARTGRPRADSVMPVDEPEQAADDQELDALVGEGAEEDMLLDGEQALDGLLEDADLMQGEEADAAEDAGEDAEEEWHAGAMFRACGNFGFIKQDDGEDMFVMPKSCRAYGGQMPEVGARVKYVVVTDGKTGRPRADKVQPEDGAEVVLPTSSESAAPQAYHAPGDANHGTVSRSLGNYGFIHGDDGTDMFLLPQACEAFGGVMPPEGTYVRYYIVTDNKTGRPRASEVKPASIAPSMGAQRSRRPPTPPPSSLSSRQDWSSPRPPSHAPRPTQWQTSAPGELVGTMSRSMQEGKFGFINGDDGTDMFVIPQACQAFGGGLPEFGTRVTYSVVTDTKTGRPRAENVQPADEAGQMEVLSLSDAGPRGHGDPWAGGMRQAGYMFCHRDNGKFGFIKQDDGVDMFLLPGSCATWGKVLPPVGSRLVYEVITDEKTGRPRAEHVEFVPGPPFGENNDGYGGDTYGPMKGGKGGKSMRSEPYGKSGSGKVVPYRKGGKGAAPAAIANGPGPSWSSWGAGPPTPSSTPRSRGPPTGTPVAPGEYATGTIKRILEKFGFIEQDSGEEDMFVLPGSCQAIGGVIPEVGSRVRYTTVIDDKTGRPRAEEVEME